MSYMFKFAIIRRGVMWLLHQLPFDPLHNEIRKRGWRPIPVEYAEKAYPQECKTGWWPLLGESP